MSGIRGVTAQRMVVFVIKLIIRVLDRAGDPINPKAKNTPKYTQKNSLLVVRLSSPLDSAVDNHPVPSGCSPTTDMSLMNVVLQLLPSGELAAS
jgi:hypothetical protein